MNHIKLESDATYVKKRGSTMISFKTNKRNEYGHNFGHKCFIRIILLMSCIILENAFSFNKVHAFPVLHQKSSLLRTYSNMSSLKKLIPDSNDEDVSSNTKVNAKSKPNEKLHKDAPKNPRTMINFPYASAVKALRSYHMLHGDLVMPRRYIVSVDSPGYPKEWYGNDLSGTVYNMQWWQRHVRSHPDRVSELNELGFVWERLQPEWNIVLEALIIYSNIYGNVLVPSAFVVPRNDNAWPKATWGIRLGNCVHRIRLRHDFVKNHPDRIQQLDGLDFVWDNSEHAFQMFFRALSYFSKIHQGYHASGRRKALRVPSTYIVPSDDQAYRAGWPQDLWNYPLGERCSAVRHKLVYVKNNPERRQALESIGFIFSPNSTLGWLEVVHAAAIYSNLHGRELNVPQKFVVPAPPKLTWSADIGGTENGVFLDNPNESWPWPEYLWGLHLGQRLKDIRVKNRYLTGESAASRRAQLNALGFDWNPKRGRRRQKIITLDEDSLKHATSKQ